MKNEGGKMKQNERQERPRPLQKRELKSTTRPTPRPSELFMHMISKEAKALSGTCSATAGPESAGHTILK